MEISDFRMIRKIGKNLGDLAFVAAVTITEGWWVLKKSRRVLVAREYGGSWFYLETGEPTPTYRIDELEKAAAMRERLHNDELQPSQNL